MIPLTFLFLLEVFFSFGKWIVSFIIAVNIYQMNESNLLLGIIAFVLTFLTSKFLIWIVEFLTVPLGYHLEQKNQVNGVYSQKYTKASRRGRG